MAQAMIVLFIKLETGKSKEMLEEIANDFMTGHEEVLTQVLAEQMIDGDFKVLEL